MAPPAPRVASGPQAFSPRSGGATHDDERRRALGRVGEEWVVKLERKRLIAAERADLADKVEHSAVVHGDGLGYDVRSFETAGGPRYIEVKTTTRDVRAEFMITANEVNASTHYGERYHLYRVFNWGKRPGVYLIVGPLAEKLQLTPETWRARPA